MSKFKENNQEFNSRWEKHLHLKSGLFMLLPPQLAAVTLLKDSEVQKILTIGHMSFLVKDYFFQKCHYCDPLSWCSALGVGPSEIRICQWGKVGTVMLMELVPNI